MISFPIEKNNSPKFYLLLSDIYGTALALTAADFVSLTYSVYKVDGTTRTSVSGFSDIPINTTNNWFSTVRQYPAGVVGLTSDQAAKGYNLTFFPYVATTTDGVVSWTSPFTEAGKTYDIDVTAVYFMQDGALSGSARLSRTETIRVVVSR